jgi:hypothetical protein
MPESKKGGHSTNARQELMFGERTDSCAADHLDESIGSDNADYDEQRHK